MVVRDNFIQTYTKANPESGYALPSVLLMVMILSLVAASVISAMYFERQQALLAVAKVKAEYAAESGVAHLLSGCMTVADLEALIVHGTHTYSFADGSEASVSAAPWGLLLALTSLGRFKAATVTQRLLVGDLPTTPFTTALIFGNQDHQLVFSGNSHVKGDIIVGYPGVSTGSLQGGYAPSRIPVDGRVRRMNPLHIPDFMPPFLDRLIADFNNRVNGSFGNVVVITSSQGVEAVAMEDISDSLQGVFVMGDVEIRGSLVRGETPLHVGVKGDVTIAQGADLRGLVAVYASGQILIVEGSKLEHVLLTSERSITVDSNVGATVQLIAPEIHVGYDAVLSYPTNLLSISFSPVSPSQTITLSSGSRIEGVVSMIIESTPEASFITVEEGANVVGALYSQGMLTLDGKVVGSVLTRDFYFHHHPATYYGWLRGGIINRTLLPEGFLIPPGFSHETKLGVLDWL